MKWLNHKLPLLITAVKCCCESVPSLSSACSISSYHDAMVMLSIGSYFLTIIHTLYAVGN